MRIETLWKYNEEPRNYHTLYHIARMMELVRLHNLKLTIAQKIAIAHHDTVYRFGRDDNEDMAARNMYFEEKGSYAPATLNMAYKIILSTQRHEPLVKQACDVIDLDLFGLWHSNTYGDTLIKVRDEYMMSGLSLDDWVQARKKWLGFMMGKKQIFYGFWKSQKHDDQARKNMAGEMAAYSEWSTILVPNGDGVVQREKNL
jgi:predicted metal-dependent HD superfamily phosphohydrolase